MSSTSNLVTHLMWSITLHCRQTQARHTNNEGWGEHSDWTNETTKGWSASQDALFLWCKDTVARYIYSAFSDGPPSLTKLTNKTPACLSVSWLLILQGSTSGLIPYYCGYVKCKHLTVTHFQGKPPTQSKEINRIPAWWAWAALRVFPNFIGILSTASARCDGGNVGESDWLLNPSHSRQSYKEIFLVGSFSLEPL